MAVDASKAVDTGSSGRHTPTRTCVGCRRRVVAAVLLRVVVTPDAIGSAGDCSTANPLVPDPRRRMPGRGAWVHRSTDCVDLAERRRAFARALRVSGPVDPAPIREYLAAAQLDAGTAPSAIHTATTSETRRR